MTVLFVVIDEDLDNFPHIPLSVIEIMNEQFVDIDPDEQDDDFDDNSEIEPDKTYTIRYELLSAGEIRLYNISGKYLLKPNSVQ